MLRRLLLVLVIGCSSSLPPASSDLAVARDLAGGCQKDADCRLYSSTCDGCSCLHLLVSDPDPVCNGTMVSCFVDPCSGMVARCNAGHCVTE
jgi:hypothetical protein